MCEVAAEVSECRWAERPLAQVLLVRLWFVQLYVIQYVLSNLGIGLEQTGMERGIER